MAKKQQPGQEHVRYEVITQEDPDSGDVILPIPLPLLKQLGWKEIQAQPFDCDDDTALRILIADNRSTDLATYDDTALLELLKELAATDKELDGTLFDGDDLQRLLDDTTPPPPPEPATIICPECGAQVKYEP